jgi:ABC-type antimicrobial peptide transport system permease subunit
MAQLSFFLRHSFNDLRVNGQRTFFALLCIAAGVAAIVSLQTLGGMIEDTLTGSLRETNRGDLRIFPFVGFGEDGDLPDDEAIEAEGLVSIDEEGGPSFTPQGLQTLEAWLAENYAGEFRLTYQQSLDAFASGISLNIPARDTDKPILIPIIIDGQAYPLFGEIETTEGQPLASVLQSPTDIVISQNVADDTGAQVGDIARLRGTEQEFTIAGIVPTEVEGGIQNIIVTFLGYYYLDHSATQYFEEMVPGTASTVYVALDNEDLDVVDDLRDQLEEDYPYLSASTTGDIEEQNSLLSTLVNQLVSVMGLVSMLIGGIGIINTMLVVVTRRTTEVAVLKTLGMQGENITLLFLVEAIIMGILGSLLGIFLGWGMAYALQGIPENFVAQELTFRPSLTAALNGFVVGVVVTAIFGFIPTLAAGQIRPANVLRPNDTILPRNGLLRTFAALMAILFALSLLTQGVLSELMNWDGNVLIVPVLNGVFIGFLMGAPIALGGLLSMWQAAKGRSWALFGLIWVFLLFGLPILGGVFGYFVPSITVISITFIMMASLYLLLLLLIWAISGAPLTEFPVIGGLSIYVVIPLLIGCVLWTIFIAVAIGALGLSGTSLALFLGILLPIHIPAVIVTLVIPGWLLGQLLQRFGFLDLKIALRAMAATKSRGATTLLALVIGIFVLSTITMLVDRLLNYLDTLLEEQTGGNVLVFPAQPEQSLTLITNTLDEAEGVNAYGVLRSYSTLLLRVEDVSRNETLTMADLMQRIADSDQAEFLNEDQIADLQDELENNLSSIDARDLGETLPQVSFFDGRQLDPARDNEPDSDGYYPLVISANNAVIGADIEEGDILTFAINNDPEDTLSFRVVGLVDNRGGNLQGATAVNYAPLAAFGQREPDNLFVVADVDEGSIPPLRRELNEIPGVFVFETRLFNDLARRIIDQFTSFPTLVALLSLFTGAIVIANSVALATLERRREIGIMKAVGLQRERVLLMLLLENGLMGLVGGLIGVGMGVLILFFLLVVLFESSLGEAIPFVQAFLLMGACILIALIAAIISVWGASGEKPLNVLRYE